MTLSFLYFAYGSNLLRQRLQLDNPSAVFVAIGRLDGYDLTFDILEPADQCPWKGAVATIRKSPGDSVWGAIWSLNETDRPNLDRQEKWYFPRLVLVTSPEGKTYECLTYELQGVHDFSHQPSPQYKDVIVRGATIIGLPESYIQKLRRIQDNGFQGKVSLYDDILRELEMS